MYNKIVGHSSSPSDIFTVFRGKSRSNTRLCVAIRQHWTYKRYFSWYRKRPRGRITNSVRFHNPMVTVKIRSSLYFVRLIFLFSVFFCLIYFLKSLSVAITTNHANLNFPHKDLSLFNWWYLSIPQLVLIIFGLDIRLCRQLNTHIPPTFNCAGMNLRQYITRLNFFLISHHLMEGKVNYFNCILVYYN